jgi:putative ABC transport system ATP-binding protein
VAEPLVILQNVSKEYVSGEETIKALDGVDLVIGRTEYLSVMGPSGSGKSTLLNVIGGIDRPTSGEVYLDGQRIERLREQQLLDLRRRKVAYVFQEARLLPSLTALENVMLPAAFSGNGAWDVRARARELLQRVGLEKRADHLVHQLSGGEAQRVCIARALMNRPLLILADEPTGNLDHRIGMDIVRLLEEIYEDGNAVLMVTHDPEVGARARRRILIRDGQVHEDSHRAG